MNQYDFKIEYRNENLNFVDDFSKRSNYENEILNKICFFTFQIKFEKITKINAIVNNSDFETSKIEKIRKKKNLIALQFRNHYQKQKLK